MLQEVNQFELAGHTFEFLTLRKIGENWLVKVAVDGKLCPPFYEPHCNVVQYVTGNRDEDFLNHMKSQALTMVEYAAQGGMVN